MQLTRIPAISSDQNGSNCGPRSADYMGAAATLDALVGSIRSRSMPLTPMRLLRIPDPFDHPDFIFEPKLDGFRVLAHVRGHRCELVSRNGHTFTQWPQLAEEIAHAVRAFSCVLDGEICCLDPDGRTNFKHLLFRRDWP